MPVLLSVMIAFERQMDFEPGAFDQLKGISGTAVLPDDGLYTKIPKTEWPKKYTKTGELKYSKATFQWSSIVVLTFPNTKLFVIIFIFKWKKFKYFYLKKNTFCPNIYTGATNLLLRNEDLSAVKKEFKVYFINYIVSFSLPPLV